jgi:gliding motility-associated-like protein
MNMKKENDIEDLFKESFENFEADVNPGSWKNIQAGLKGVGLGVLAKSILNKIGTNAIVAVVSSAATVMSTVMVMNWTGNTKTQQVASNNVTAPKTVLDKAKPAQVNEIKTFLSNENSLTKPNELKEKIKTDLNQPKESLEAGSGVAENSKKDKKKLQSLINSLSSERIAAISASCVGGAVPLIVNLSNNGIGKINKWSYNDGTKAVTSANPIKVFDVPGIYTVTLVSTGADGKTATDSVKIEATGNSSLSSIPREISPNGDGNNDVFKFNSHNIKKMNAEIYDKKGKLIYTWTGTDGEWDGKNQKGEEAKAGVYLYIISAEGFDGKKYEQKGEINLTR